MKRKTKIIRPEKLPSKQIPVALNKHHPSQVRPYCDVISHLDKLEANNQFEQCEFIYLQLLEALPGQPEVLLKAFTFYFSNEYWERAQELATQFRESSPQLAIPLLCLARIYRRLGRSGECLQLLERALRLRGEKHLVYGEMGATHIVLGDYEHAVKALEKAIKLNPAEPSNWWSLSEIPDYTFKADEVKKLKDMAESPSVPALDRGRHAFTLARIYREIDQATEFEYLDKANAVFYGASNWSIEAARDRSEKLIGFFGREWVESSDAEQPGSCVALMIAGLPRSGTTLVETILASHSAVTPFGESGALQNATKQVFADLPAPQSYWRHLDGAALKRRLPEITAETLSQLKLIAEPGRYFTDKSINNYQSAGLALLAFPEGRLIHCERHPMAICLSNYRLRFLTGLGFSYNLQALAHELITQQRLMRHWTSLFPGRVYTLRYENLVEQQEVETRKLLDFCGLEWDERCLSFYENVGNVLTASNTQVRQSLYSGAINRWRKYSKELEEARLILEPHFPQYEF